MMTYAKIIKMLSDGGVENAPFEASRLLEAYAGVPSYRVPLLREEDFEDAKLLSAVEKRATGYPLQYILGYADFYNQRYLVNENVLIPRADTEILVEKAIERLPKGARFLDLCTGSGCIALSVLCERPDTTAVGVDISQGALAVAEENAQRLGVEKRFEALQMDVFAPSLTYGEPFDAILSNPPYLTGEDMKHLQKEVTFEPSLALFGGENGLKFYQYIIPRYADFLKDDGFFLFEIGATQGNDVKRIGELNDDTAQVLCDFGGHDRVVYLRKENG